MTPETDAGAGSGPITRGYSYSKPNLQDSSVRLMDEALDALKACNTAAGLNRLSSHVTALCIRTTGLRRRDVKWSGDWDVLARSAPPLDAGFLAHLDYRTRQLELLAELIYRHGVDWKPGEDYDPDAGKDLVSLVDELKRLRAAP